VVGLSGKVWLGYLVKCTRDICSWDDW